MKPSINDILEGLDAERIGLDESFSFHCTQCGKCCQNRSDILLNPLDLYQAAKAMNISILKFVNDFCEAFPGENSLFPIIRLLPRGESKTCPMLKDNKCIIHHAKPAVCAMYPIGRGILMGPMNTVGICLEKTELNISLANRIVVIQQNLIQ